MNAMRKANIRRNSRRHKEEASVNAANAEKQKKPSAEELALTAKNYRLAKELSELRVRHREECKNVTRLTMENMNLASRCREAIGQAASLKKDLASQQRRTKEAMENILKLQQLHEQQQARLATTLVNSHHAGNAAVSTPPQPAGEILSVVTSESPSRGSNNTPENATTPVAISSTSPHTTPTLQITTTATTPSRTAASTPPRHAFSDVTAEMLRSNLNKVIPPAKAPSPVRKPAGLQIEPDIPPIKTATPLYVRPTVVSTSILVSSDDFDELDEGEDEFEESPISFLNNSHTGSGESDLINASKESNESDHNDDNQATGNETFFPVTASPKFSRTSYNEEFPGDITSEAVRKSARKLDRKKEDVANKGEPAEPVGSEELLTPFDRLGKQNDKSTLSSIDAFEASFHTDFPDSFSPTTATAEEKARASASSEIYNPFLSSPSKPSHDNQRLVSDLRPDRAVLEFNPRQADLERSASENSISLSEHQQQAIFPWAVTDDIPTRSHSFRARRTCMDPPGKLKISRRDSSPRMKRDSPRVTQDGSSPKVSGIKRFEGSPRIKLQPKKESSPPKKKSPVTFGSVMSKLANIAGGSSPGALSRVGNGARLPPPTAEEEAAVERTRQALFPSSPPSRITIASPSFDTGDYVTPQSSPTDHRISPGYATPTGIAASAKSPMASDQPPRPEKKGYDEARIKYDKALKLRSPRGIAPPDPGDLQPEQQRCKPLGSFSSPAEMDKAPSVVSDSPSDEMTMKFTASVIDSLLEPGPIIPNGLIKRCSSFPSSGSISQPASCSTPNAQTDDGDIPLNTSLSKPRRSSSASAATSQGPDQSARLASLRVDMALSTSQQATADVAPAASAETNQVQEKLPRNAQDETEHSKSPNEGPAVMDKSTLEPDVLPINAEARMGIV